MADEENPAWLSILLLLLAVLGSLSNILVCLTILRTKNLRDTTHFLILNLAVSDGLCCFTLGLDMLMDLLGYPDNSTSEAAEILFCRFMHGNYLFQSFAYTSAYNLVIIALERYVGIVLPLRYHQVCTKRAVRLAVALAWTLGFCAYSVHLIGVVYTREELYFADRCKLSHDWKWHFVPFLGGFVVPLLTMIWAYYGIIRALRMSASNQVVPARASESREATRRVIHLMLIVTVAYVVLYIPTQPAYMVIVNINIGTFEVSSTGIILTNLASKLPVLINSVINPFIYAFKYKKFQEGMRETVCRCVWHHASSNAVLDANESNSVTAPASVVLQQEGSLNVAFESINI